MQQWYFTHTSKCPNGAMVLIFTVCGFTPDVITHTKFFIYRFSGFGVLTPPKTGYLYGIGWSLLQQCKHCRAILWFSINLYIAVLTFESVWRIELELWKVMRFLPASTFSPLQCVQNAAAKLIFGHITPAQQQLHWLPVIFQIIFKVAALMHNIFHHCAPHTSAILSLSTPVILIVTNYGRQQSDLPWSTTQEPSLADMHLLSVYHTSGTI